MGPDRLLLEVNEAWEAFTGYRRAEAVGRSFAEFLDGPSAKLYCEKAVPEFIDTVPASESRAVEYRLIKRSGEVANIVLTARPERDPRTGRFLYSLSVINDITARSRAEAALRQAQNLEALGRLTSGVAHDFNNLLTIILSSLQLLGKRLPADDPRAARLLEAAMQGTRRGAALTSRLLSFSRQQDLVPMAVDPVVVMGTLRPMLAQLLGPGIAIEEDLPEGLWNLRADPGQLELSLLNLAANARDAMPQGGRLCLAARNARVDTVESIFIAYPQPAAAVGEYVVLTMSDSGVGMDEEALARAADPFFTTKGVGKGTGLGLSMVHGFAMQSGGALTMSSQPGVGTTVELWLPRTTEVFKAVGEPPVPTAVASRGRRLRILVVDDDPLVVASTTDMLEDLGHDPVCAASGEEALAVLAQDGAFDLLLTDVMMPGMNGVTLANQVRALHAGLPIVLASGFAELDGLARADWPRLRKPYDLKDLSAALVAVAGC